jgi:hypothetical protein
MRQNGEISPPLPRKIQEWPAERVRYIVMSEPWATGKFSVSSTAKFSVIDVPQKGKGGGGSGGSAVPASTKDAAGNKYYIMKSFTNMHHRRSLQA